MAQILQTVTIKKNGASLYILYYGANGEIATKTRTITGPTGVQVFNNDNIITIDPDNITAMTFNQSVNGTNRITQVNETDVTAYTAIEVRDLLQELFASGFDSGDLVVQDVTILNLTTSATGSTFVAFTDTPCNAVDVVNATGQDLEYRRNGDGLTMYMPDQTSRMIEGITNANQIEFRRIDVSNTQLTFTAEAITK